MIQYRRANLLARVFGCNISIEIRLGKSVVICRLKLPCHSDPATCPAYEGFVFCHPEPCPVVLLAKVDSPVEAGEVADEVRQKGGAPAEGAQDIFLFC